MSRLQSKSKNRTAPRNSSPTKDPKFLMIRQRINEIASSMRSPLKSLKASMTPDPSNKENSMRTPRPKTAKRETLDEFLHLNNLENYAYIFKENQVTMQDLPFLTKEDLIDMKLPIGPRKRLLSLVENMENNITVPAILERSPKRYGINEEVDKFMTESSQFSKRSEPNVRYSSKNISLDVSFESEMHTQRICDSISGVIKELRGKQSFMMKAIEENQRAIAAIRLQYSSGRMSRCLCEDYH